MQPLPNHRTVTHTLVWTQWITCVDPQGRTRDRPCPSQARSGDMHTVLGTYRNKAGGLCNKRQLVRETCVEVRSQGRALGCSGLGSLATWERCSVGVVLGSAAQRDTPRNGSMQPWV